MTTTSGETGADTSRIVIARGRLTTEELAALVVAMTLIAHRQRSGAAPADQIAGRRPATWTRPAAYTAPGAWRVRR